MQKSYLDCVIEVMQSSSKPLDVYEIIKRVTEIAGVSEKKAEKDSYRIYNIIVSSGNFVFCGNNTWDLKNRQPISLVDKDSSHFTTDEEAKDIKELLRTKESTIFKKSDSPMRFDFADEVEIEVDTEETEVAEVTEEAQAETIVEEVVEETKNEETEEVVIEEVKEEKKKEEVVVEDEVEEEYEEYIEEEEYNEIMDQYEDLYDEE